MPTIANFPMLVLSTFVLKPSPLKLYQADGAISLVDLCRLSEPVFVNLLGSPRIDSQPGGPVPEPVILNVYGAQESIPFSKE